MTLRNNLLAFALISLLIISCDKENDPDLNKELAWTEMQSFPGTARRHSAGFWIGNKFYTGFGQSFVTNKFIDQNDFYEFDASSNTWTKKADFPDIGRQQVVAFSIGNTGYVGFGMSINCFPCTFTHYKDLWKYDPATDSWEKVGDYNDINDNETPLAKAYVISGKAYITLKNNLWMFNSSTNSLTLIGPLPESAVMGTGFGIDDKIYMVAGGRYPTYIKTFYEFNTSTKVWTEKGDFPGQARSSATGFAVKNKGYITCGQIEDPFGPRSSTIVGTTDTWRYDPASDQWAQINDYPGLGYIYQASASAGEFAAVGTGQTGSTSDCKNDFWLIK